MSVEKDQQKQRKWFKTIGWKQLKDPNVLKYIVTFGVTIYRIIKFILNLIDRG